MTMTNTPVTHPRIPPSAEGQDAVRALLYHAGRVREIARSLGGRDAPAPEWGAPAAGRAVAAGEGEAAVRQLVQKVQRRAVASRISLSPDLSGVRPPEVEALYAALLRGRGPLRLVVPRSLLLDEDERRLLSRYTAAGAVARAASVGLPEMVVIDGAVAMLCEPGARGTPTVVADPLVVRALEALFDAVWVQSPDAGHLAELDAAALRAAGEDGGTLARVLELLGAGWTDEAAARELGCSVRTYRRHVAVVMRLLRARSRFQAGLRAGQWQVAAAR
ncbi:helix-turn-helix transcriptional regulator [Streptomyces sp. x-80]|uniref:helix-turn-helix transcriptional regulator n=1 Tax=Streptomyces sp. x-80 TaxID=2789282 RepID=UPI00397EFBD4